MRISFTCASGLNQAGEHAQEQGTGKLFGMLPLLLLHVCLTDPLIVDVVVKFLPPFLLDEVSKLFFFQCLPLSPTSVCFYSLIFESILVGGVKCGLIFVMTSKFTGLKTLHTSLTLSCSNNNILSATLLC